MVAPTGTEGNEEIIAIRYPINDSGIHMNKAEVICMVDKSNILKLKNNKCKPRTQSAKI